MASIDDLSKQRVDLTDYSFSAPRTNGYIGRNTGTGANIPYSDAMAVGNEFSQGLKDNPSSPSSVADLPDLSFLSGDLQSQISSFLNNSQIPQARKDAFLSAYSGLTSALPTQSGLDKFSEAVIGTSNYQKAMNKLGTDVGALLAQHNITDYQEKYNSAEQQASRLQEAGVNPDLQGTSVDPGSSSDFDDQSTGLDSPSSVYPSYDGSAAGTILQVISGVFSWASSIQGLIRNGIDLSTAKVAEQSADIDYIQKLAHNADFTPDSSVTFPPLVHSDVYGEDVSLTDDKGNLLPYSKLNAKQRDAVSSYFQEHNLRQISDVWSNYYFDNSFSENKKRRLKQRLQDYIKSEQFRSKWYEDHRNLISNRLNSAKDSSDPMFNAVDVLLESCQKALSESQYSSQTDSNLLASEQAKEMLKQGLPKEHVLQELRQLNRDKADNKVMDDFRDYLLDISEGFERVNGKRVKKTYDKWESITAKIGLIFLYLVRNGGISALNPLK